MSDKFDTISSKIEKTNPYWDYVVEEYVFPNGRKGNYYFVRTKGSTIIIPVLSKNTFVLVRQYRYLSKKISLEFPGGGIASGLSAEESSIKELKEEAGYYPRKIRKIGEFYPFIGVSDEICEVFLAENLTPAYADADESEEIEAVELRGEEIEDKIASGEIWEGRTLAAWSIFLANNKGFKL